jgi:hypothetical protein
MPTFFNFNKRKGVFMIPAGATKSPTPAPPSFSNTKSLSLDGVDEYVDLGTSSTLEFTNDFSVSVWIKDTASLNRGIFCCGNRSGTSGWMLYRTSTNKVAFSVYTANNRIATSTTSINTGDWFNVIGTFEKNGTANQQVKVYVNGSLEGQNGWASPQTPSYSGTIYKQIAFPYAGANEFLGNIDEVAAFNYLLSTDEINTVSTAPSDLTSLNPTVWYRCGDNSTYQTPQILMPENENKNKLSNYSLSFDGVGDYMNTNSNSLFNGLTAFSVSCWIKRNGTQQSYAAVLSYQTSTSQYIKLNFNTYTDKIEMAIRPGSTSVVKVTSSAGSITDGEWVHIAVVGDANNLSNLNMYINGVLDNDITSGNITTLAQSSDIYIGTDAGAITSREFSGNIDEVAIWDTALTSEQITSIYNGGEPTTISGSTAYWKLGEQSKFTDNWLVPNSALSNYSKFSFNFDGVDDYVEVNPTIKNFSTDNFTISSWVKFDTLPTSTNEMIIYNELGSANRYVRLTTRGSQPNILFRYGNGGNNYLYGSTTITTGVWYYVAITYSTTEGIKLYLNGSEDASASYLALDRSAFTDASIGAYDYAGTQLFYLDGNIDETAIYDTALNSTQISELYNSGEPTTIPSGGVAHWRMGEDATYNSSTSEWTIPDQVGSNDGTSSNTMALDTLVGEAPNYFGGGVSNAMTIEDRIGDAPNSLNNAVSFNMEAEDIDNNTP